MEPTFRRAFNAAFQPSTYTDYIGRLEKRLGCSIPFRVAETPLFIPDKLRRNLERSAAEIAQQISNPALIEKMKQAIPPPLNVPSMDALPNCVQVDLAITRGPDGELEGKLVELQGFPSLYALMVIQLEECTETLRKMPGLDRRWSLYFGGRDRDAFVAWLKRAVLAGEPPESVVLLDLTPEAQKTYPDFAAAKLLLGIDSVCPTELF
jgi:hypothetical protein